jgi:hypothetical protein
MHKNELPWHNEDILINAYKEKSTIQLSEEWDVSHVVISDMLNRFGIETRDSVENQRFRFDYGKLDDKKWLKEKYIDDKLSIQSIGNIIDVIP